MSASKETLNKSFSDAEYVSKEKQTLRLRAGRARREVFLAEMDRAVPWSTQEALIAPHYPKAASSATSRCAIAAWPRTPHAVCPDQHLDGASKAPGDGIAVSGRRASAQDREITAITPGEDRRHRSRPSFRYKMTAKHMQPTTHVVIVTCSDLP